MCIINLFIVNVPTHGPPAIPSQTTRGLWTPPFGETCMASLWKGSFWNVYFLECKYTLIDITQ